MTHESPALGMLFPSQIGVYVAPAVGFALFAIAMILSLAHRQRRLDWMHPELRHISTWAEKRQVVRDAYKERGRRNRRAVIGWGLLLGCIPAIVTFGFASLPGFFGSPQWIRVAVSMPVILLGCGLWMRWNRRTARPFIVAELAKRGIPLCRSCGYDLTGLTEQRCPECGGTFSEAQP